MLTKEQEREFFNRDFVIQGRIMHPALVNPVGKMVNNVQKPPSYSVMLVWPQNSNANTMGPMQQFIQQAFQTCHQGIDMRVLINPIKDQTYLRGDGKPNPDYTNGCFWVNANSGEKFPPVIVDQNRQQVINPAEVYSGRNAVVNISFYNMAGANGGKRGLGVNIKAVMLLEGGEKLEGGAQVDIDAVFGNFQIDAGIAQAAPMQQGQYVPPAQGLNALGMAANPYTQQQAPVQQPAQQPYQAPVQQPYQAPVQQPAQAPAQWAPQQENVQPVQQPAQAPAAAPAPAWTPAPNPAAAPAQAPAQMPPGHNPFTPQQ